MPDPKLSVVVPTHQRPDRLNQTLTALSNQRDLRPADYELIVVDDGSVPPAAVERGDGGPTVRLIRLEGEGPSAARNRGAREAAGELLVFVDDDLEVVPDFLASHWGVHLERPGVLQVGSIHLPEAVRGTPFGRFRQSLEAREVPMIGNPVAARNLCTAANMAIERDAFERLGGFDPELTAGEDQDLAIRYTGAGGEIVLVDDASGTHNDDALRFADYCDRSERYMEELVRFGARHPDWPDTVERARVNGPAQWGREPMALSAKKVLKRFLLLPPVHCLSLRLVSLVERLAPDSRLLDWLYRSLLGAQLLRGYRRGLGSANG